MNKFIFLLCLLFSSASFAGTNGIYTNNGGVNGGGGGGGTTAPTAPQFDDSTKIANTHWVQQRGEQGSSFILVSESQSITLASAGGRIASSPQSGNSTYTLPLLSSIPDGVPFGLWNVNSADDGNSNAVVLATQADDIITGPGIESSGLVTIPPAASIWVSRETIDVGEGPQVVYLILGDKGSMGVVGGVSGHQYKGVITYTDQNVNLSQNQIGYTIEWNYMAGGGQMILPDLTGADDNSNIKIISQNCTPDVPPNNVSSFDEQPIRFSNKSSNTSENLQCGDWDEFTVNVRNVLWENYGGSNALFYSKFWRTPVFYDNPRALNQSSPGAVVVQPSAFGQYSVTNDPGPFHTISSESIAQFSSDATIFNSQGVQLVGHHYGTWNPIGGGGNIDEATAGGVNLISDGGNNYALPFGTNYAPGQAYVATSAAAGNILQSANAILVGTTVIASVPLGQYDTAEMVANGEGYSLVGGSALFPYSNYFQNQQISSLVAGTPSGGNCGSGCINAQDIRIGNSALVQQFQPTIFGALTVTSSSGHQNIITRGDTGDISNITFNNAVGNVEEGEMNIGPSLFEFRAFGTDGYLFSSLGTNTLSLKQNTQHLFGGVTVGGGTEASVVSGELGYASISATGVAPGAGFCKEEWVPGTLSGTGKKIAYCGTSTTPTTIVDNVGGGL